MYCILIKNKSIIPYVDNIHYSVKFMICSQSVLFRFKLKISKHATQSNCVKYVLTYVEDVNGISTLPL